MGDLTENQLGSVRMLIQVASDQAIGDLEAALSSGSERHEAMRTIQRMVSAEADDRRVRNQVLAPVLPMCSPRRQGLACLTFPPLALAQVWRGLKEEAKPELDRLMVAFSRADSDGPPAEMMDALCRKAAAGLRAREAAGYAAAAETLERASPGSVEAMASCLELAPVARSALERLPEWLGRLTEERAAAARLTFRDATKVSEDCGPRLLEILYAHLQEPWTVLRLVSAVMQRPADRYVATSELATFGERLLEDVDRSIKAVSSLNLDGGAAAGTIAGQAVRASAQVIAEFDECVDLAHDGPWGSRITRQKRSLAVAVESRLKIVDSEVAAALPLQSSGFRRSTRGHPNLKHDPDQRHVERAKALLCFMRDVRGSADRLGFGALWTKTAEALQARIDTYVEDLLERLRSPEEVENYPRIRAYLDIAAEFLGLSSDDKAAQIVRRRVAAAA